MARERPRQRLRQSAASGDRVIDDEHDNGSDDGNEHRIDVETCDARAADAGEDQATDKSADDPEHDIQDAALAALMDDPACDETGDQPEHDPAYERHLSPLKPRQR